MDNSISYSKSNAEKVSPRIRSAKRHSLIVRLARIMLPTSMIALTAFLVIFNFERRQENPILQEVSAEELENKDIVMEQPSIIGVNENNVAYDFSAFSAIQQDPNNQEIFLSQLAGLFDANGRESKLLATEAIYLQDDKVLDILSSGRYSTADGRVATFPQARINVNEQLVTIDNGVIYDAPTTSLRAAKAVLNDKTKEYFFEGRVNARIFKGAQ